MPRNISILAALVFLAAATGWAHEAQVRVEWKNDTLSVTADGAPLEEVLLQVAEATGIWMDLRGSFPEPVRVSFAGRPLREGVTEILAGLPGRSYAIVDFHDPDTGAVTIALSVGRAGAEAAAPAAAAGGFELEVAPRRPRPGARQPAIPAASSATVPTTSTPSGDPLPSSGDVRKP